jgi:uncharacterized membrane protein YraQ (UPF0718 family)
MMNKKSPAKKIILLLGGAGLSLLILYLVNPAKFSAVLENFIKLVVQIVPILFFVFAIMVLVNYFLDKKFLQQNMVGQSSLKKWGISIFAGILSVGPVYAWYPLMKDFQEKGIENRFIASFLYNRGIKIQWMSVLILYFGWTYTLTLFVVMTIFSIPQGIITEKLIKFSE